jgi:Ca2+-binding EF-hand superfamily protein
MILQRLQSVVLILLLLCLPAPAVQAQQVQQAGDYLARMDADGDGRVSLDEYLAWMGYAFERMDRNHDDVLTADELPGGRGTPLTRAAHRAQLTARFRRQDANHDGYLDARELTAPPR